MSMQVQCTGIGWYERKDYPAILKVMKDASVLPRTYNQWLQKAEALEYQIQSRGVRVVRAKIDSRTFPEWCRANGLDVDAQARMAFANEEAAREMGVLK